MDDLLITAVPYAVVCVVVVAVIYIVWLRLTPGVSRQGGDSHDPLLQAMVALTEGEVARAEQTLARAVESSPDDPALFLLYGILLRRHDAERSALVLEGTLARRDLTPAAAEIARRALVEALIASHKEPEAVRWIQRLSETSGKEPEATERDGRLALAARAYAEAHAIGVQLEHLDRVRGRAFQALALTAEAEDLADAGAADEAAKLLKKALGRDRTLASTWALEGLLHLQSGNLAKARSAMVEAFRLEPGIGIAIFPNIEDRHLEVGKVADYEGMLHGLLEERPRDPVVLWALGRHLARRQHLDEAARALQDAVDASPDFVPAVVELARLEAEQQGRASRRTDTQPPTTRCLSCGTAGVRAIVRCPVCNHVGDITFKVAGSMPPPLNAPALADAVEDSP